jgi:hypothetical protein
MAGVTFDQLVSYVATVSSVTRKSASSIGESFKTMFARFQDVRGGKNFDADNEDISNVERDFEKYAKIKIRETSGQFKDFSVVIEELSKKWNTLNEVEQSGVAKALAGVRQRENFLVLMNNMNKALDLQTKEADSAGSAMERYGIYSKSTEAKINDFKNAVQTLWMNLMNSEGINKIITFGTELTNIVNRITQQFGGWNLAIIAINIAAIAFAKTLISVNVQLAAQGTLSFGAAIKQLIPAFLGAGAGAGVLNGELIAMNALAAGIPLIIGLITTGLFVYANASQEATEETLKHKDAMEVLTKSYKELRDEQEQTNKQINESLSSKMGEVLVAQKLSGELDNLSKKENKTLLDKTRMKQIVDQLNTAIPNLNLAINNETGALSEQISVINDAIGAYKELLFLKAQEQRAQAAAARIIDAQLNIDKENEKAATMQRDENGAAVFYSSNGAYNDVVKKNQQIIDEANTEIQKSFDMAQEYAKKYPTTVLSNGNNGGGGYGAGGGGGSEFKAESIEIEGLVEPLIKAANAQSKLTEAEGKHLERQIQLAEKSKDYNKELELTNKLIENQSTNIKDLDTANDKIGSLITDVKTSDSERAKRKGTSPYDIGNWFTADGGSSGIHEALINSLELKTQAIASGGGDEHAKQDKINTIKDEIKYIKDLFDDVSKLKGAYAENQQSVEKLQDSVDANQQKIDSNKTDILLKKIAENASILSDKMTELDNKEQLLSENDLQNKVEILNDKISLQKDLIAQNKSNLDEYSATLKDLSAPARPERSDRALSF